MLESRYSVLSENISQLIFNYDPKDSGTTATNNSSPNNTDAPVDVDEALADARRDDEDHQPVRDLIQEIKDKASKDD